MGDLIFDLQAQNMPFMGCQVARECIRGVKHDAACKCARALSSSDGFESKSPFSPWAWDSIPSRQRQEEQSPSDDARALMQNLSRCRIPLLYIHDSNSTAAFLESIIFSIRPQGSVFSLRETVHT